MQIQNAKDYIPQRVGLQFSPPTIVIEYLIPTQQKIFRHKIKLMRLTAKSNTTDFVKYIKNRHHAYVANSKLLDDQLETLINRLKDKLNELSQKRITDKEDSHHNQNNKISSFREHEVYNQKSSPTPIKPTYKETNPVSNKFKEKQQEPIKVHVFEEINIESDEDTKKKDDDEDEIYEEDFESQDQSDLQSVDLNKFQPEEVQKYKQKMDVKYTQNLLKPGDPGFVYDKQVAFKPTKKNDWDDD